MLLVLWEIIGPLIRFEGLQEALLSAAWSLVDSCVTEVGPDAVLPPADGAFIYGIISFYKDDYFTCCAVVLASLWSEVERFVLPDCES